MKLNGTDIFDRQIRVEKFKLSKFASEKKDKKQKKLKKGNAPEAKANGKAKVKEGKTAQLKDTNKQKEKKKNQKNKEFLGLKSNDKKKVGRNLCSY